MEPQLPGRSLARSGHSARNSLRGRHHCKGSDRLPSSSYYANPRLPSAFFHREQTLAVLAVSRTVQRRGCLQWVAARRRELLSQHPPAGETWCDPACQQAGERNATVSPLLHSLSVDQQALRWSECLTALLRCLRLSPRLSSGRDRGLLGAAFSREEVEAVNLACWVPFAMDLEVGLM